MTEYNDLKDKTVLITGGNRGLGEGIGRAFEKQGCAVAAIYRSQRPAWAKNPRSVFIRSDISDIPKIGKWLKRFEKKDGRIDVLVNCAGIYLRDSLLDVTSRNWDRTMTTNLKSTFMLSRLIADHMKKNHGGVIINAASFAASIPSAGYGVYAASKAALVSLTRTMAAEWAPFGIRVNAFSPGVVPTRMTRPAIKGNRNKMLRAISLHRFGTIDEIADTVLFLSSRSSSYITGINLDVNGGKFAIQDPGAVSG